jgi:hypothetical protein
MTKRPTPRWQPISQLPFIADVIDGMLASAAETGQALEEARPKPYVLDDATVHRVLQVYTAQQNDLWLYEEQLRRWGTLSLTAAQRQEVERLVGQLARLRQVIAANLALAKELQGGTIEQVLSKSDAELGLEFLLRHLPKQ